MRRLTEILGDGIAVLRDGKVVNTHPWDDCVLCRVMRGEADPTSYGIEQPYGINPKPESQP